ncbi:ribosome maturation factor RimP [[Acholeplasma] multilocale]|uniref:ribosome maturation factor RimP n=1 Tax=[Acholeplasma] multilocale TaxID=264638 RepID=UPI00047C584B|nr:ribosome maturation factor RimP [[Acholeplasma] multilocale]
MRNFSNVKNDIENMANAILAEHNLRVYEVNNLHDFESDVLQILVEDATQPNKPLDFDALADVNEKISDAMDKFESIKKPYMLEIASAGIEKVIRNKDELIRSIGGYVHFDFNKSVNKLMTIEGIVADYNSETDEFRIEYFIKGQKKKSLIKWEDIRAVRYAVKF